MERSGGGRLISGMQTVAPWEHLPWSGVPWVKSGAWLSGWAPRVSTRGSVTVVPCWFLGKALVDSLELQW